MQYLNTFWKTVVSKIPYLNLKQLKVNLEQDLIRLEQIKLKQGKLMQRLDLLKANLEQMKLNLEQIRLENIEQMELNLEQIRLENMEMKWLFNPKTPKFSVEIRQKSHIKGWLSKILLEEWRGELEVLRCTWLKERKPELWIKIMTGFCLLGLLKACLQIKVENRWLPKKKQS